MTSAPDVLVVGAGVIGLSVAWRCLARGLTVTVVDPAPGSGASWTAAGMLAPVTELHYGEQPLLALNLASAARYPAFAAELTEATGDPIGYRRTGTVVAAWDGADLAALRDLAAFAHTLGRPMEPLTGRELRGLLPGIAPGLPGGLLAADDHQVDNRLLHAALLAAVTGAGGELVREAVARIDVGGGRRAGDAAASGRAGVRALGWRDAGGGRDPALGRAGRRLGRLRRGHGEHLDGALAAIQPGLPLGFRPHHGRAAGRPGGEIRRRDRHEPVVVAEDQVARSHPHAAEHHGLVDRAALHAGRATGRAAAG